MFFVNINDSRNKTNIMKNFFEIFVKNLEIVLARTAKVNNCIFF